MSRNFLIVLTALASFGPAIAARDCTSTMTLTLSRLPTPPYWPQCAFDGLEHLYPATRTAYRSVDCAGCSHVKVTTAPEVHCPAKIYTSITTETTATTLYSTVCAK